MTINVPSEIGAVLAELAAKLGVAAEALWAVLLRQQTLCGTGWLVIAAIAVVGAICLGCAAYRQGRGYCSCPPDVGGLCWAAVAALMLAVALTWEGLLHLLNPAFYALNYILGVLR